MSATGLYPLHERRLYRPRGTLIQPLLECEGGLSARVACTDPTGHSISFHNLQLLEYEGPVPLSARVAGY